VGDGPDVSRACSPLNLSGYSVICVSELPAPNPFEPADRPFPPQPRLKPSRPQFSSQLHEIGVVERFHTIFSGA
jgi:hypothetical protein